MEPTRREVWFDRCEPSVIPRSSRSLWCAASAIVAALILPLTHAAAQASGNEWLYGVRQVAGVGLKLDRLDLSSGAVLTSKLFPATTGLSPIGLTWNGVRLLTVNNEPIADVTTTIQPADATCGYVGPTGLNVVMQSVALHPQTGVVYLATYSALYTLNPATGAATLVAPFSGFVNPTDGLSTIAIDGAGNAIGTGQELLNQSNTVYSIDLGTAHLIQVGQVQGIGDGWFRDIAISNTGEVWASFYDGGLNPNARGLYKLDPSNGYSATFVRHVSIPHYGLAFVPAPVQSTYCTAKLNSAGCSPAISGDGWPSPSAHSGYVISCDAVVNQSIGILFYTAAGRAALPFHGGTMCIASPKRRTPVLQSGGSPAGLNDCSGTWSLDFNTYLLTHAQLPAGLTLQCQWVGRDRGFAAPDNYQLSNALEVTLNP
jgi:hypothetical protein